MKTRRQFFVTSATFAAVLGLAPQASIRALAAITPHVRSLDELDYATLAAQINTRFLVRLAPLQTVELTLLQAPRTPASPRAGRGGASDAGYEKFSLVFSGPRNALLEAAIHRFEHRRLGIFDLYIGPIGLPQEKEARYEAGFNRPVPRLRPV